MKLRIIFYLFAVLATLFAPAISAACLNTSYNLRTQEQIDTFPADCVAIPGNLRIRDNGSGTAIQNLDGLDHVTSIGGFLYLDRNSNLDDISGLAMVGSVGTYLRVRSNPVLADLTGLEGISAAGSYLRIDGNTLLANVDGLSSLTSIGSFVRLENNAALDSLSGLVNVSTYGGYIRIDNNDALTSLSGITLPSATNGYVFIRNNLLLADINSLSSITSIGGFLQIRSNPGLTSLSGLEGLQSVAGYLQINSNQALLDISALSAVNSVGSNLQIINNDKLVDLAGFSLVSSVSKNVLISGNAKLLNVSGLSALASVGGYLRIDNNRRLVDLTGLSELTSVAKLFRLRNNDDLTSLAGLESLVSVGDDAVIDRSARLTDCSSLIPLVDSFDDGAGGPGPNAGVPGPGQEVAPDVGGFVTFDSNISSCNTVLEVMGSVSDPTFDQAMDPNTISISGSISKSQVSFTIDNTASAVRATEVSFSNSLPAGISLATPSNAATDCSEGTVVAGDGSSSIDFSGGIVDGGSSCSVTVDLVASIAGTFVNTTTDLIFTLGNSGTSSATLVVDDTPPVVRSYAAPLPSGAMGTLSFTSADPHCTFAAEPQFLSGVGTMPAPPEGLTLHDGVIQFEVESCAVGASVTMQMDYGTPLPAGQEYWKVANPWRSIPATTAGNTVSFTLVDGGENDDDGVANGRIVDPSGAASITSVSSSPLAVPVNPLWVLILLVGAIVTSASARLRSTRDGLWSRGGL